jgi:hypothetical protein
MRTRERRRQRVGPAVQLRVARRQPDQQPPVVDGVDITDMSATGASPSYYDFDIPEEMTITTGGVDVMQQTGGVGINLVTKAGQTGSAGPAALQTAKIRRPTRPTIRLQGRRAGNPIRTSRTTVSNRRPDQEGQGMDLGRVRHAEHQRRHRGLL